MEKLFFWEGSNTRIEDRQDSGIHVNEYVYIYLYIYIHINLGWNNSGGHPGAMAGVGKSRRNDPCCLSFICCFRKGPRNSTQKVLSSRSHEGLINP